MEIVNYYKYKLCYVKQKEDYPNLITLYFTNDMKKQWGDDWDNIPYEYNAGEPYEYETDVFSIIINTNYKDVVTPCTGHLNSPYSVKDINEGIIPWITIPNKFKENSCSLFIKAGDTLCSVLSNIENYEPEFDIYIQLKKENKNEE